MKKWFLWILPVLLLAQQPAGAVPIHYTATLAPLSGAAGPTGFGDFLFDPNPPLSAPASFAYTITLSPPADWSCVAGLNANPPTPCGPLGPNSVTGIFLTDATFNEFFTIFELSGSPPQISSDNHNPQEVTVFSNGGGSVKGEVTEDCSTSECSALFSNLPFPQPPDDEDQACALTKSDGICGPIILATVVPTPSSLPLFGIGIAGLYLLRPRRKPEQPILPAVTV